MVADCRALLLPLMVPVLLLMDRPVGSDGNTVYTTGKEPATDDTATVFAMPSVKVTLEADSTSAEGAAAVTVRLNLAEVEPTALLMVKVYVSDDTTVAAPATIPVVAAMVRPVGNDGLTE